MPKQLPACAGAFSPISFSTPDNCLLNAQYPAAVAAGNVETSSRIVDVILGALYKAIPEKIPAASYGTMNNVAMGNSDTITAAWSYYETIGGGFGAHINGAGIDARQAHMTNTLNTPIESLENHYPLRIMEYAIAKNQQIKSDFAGGRGIIRRFQFLQTTQVTLLTERRKLSPWGVNGAEEGSCGVNLLDDQYLAGKCHFTAQAGQTLTITTPGGGGYNIKTRT